MGEKKNDDILNFFDDLVEKNTEKTGKLHLVYLDDKDSLLANLFSQVEFLTNEINEKNYLIINLLNRINDNNCIIFPNSCLDVKGSTWKPAQFGMMIYVSRSLLLILEMNQMSP